MTPRISLHSMVAASSEGISCELAGETTILNLENMTYYTLEATGTRIWELMTEFRTVLEIRDILVREYDVDHARCESELLTLMQRLAEEQLIRVQPVTTDTDAAS